MGTVFYWAFHVDDLGDLLCTGIVLLDEKWVINSDTVYKAKI